MTTIRTATLVHEGGLRFAATTGTGRTVMWGDVATDGELSPVETLVTSLGACTAMDVISIAVKKRQVIDRYAVRVEAVQRDEYPRVLVSVDVLHEVEGPGVDEAAIRRAIELSATKYCPLNATISAGPTLVRHRYRVRNTGAAPFDAAGDVLVTGPYLRADPIA